MAQFSQSGYGVRSGAGDRRCEAAGGICPGRSSKAGGRLLEWEGCSAGSQQEKALQLTLRATLHIPNLHGTAIQSRARANAQSIWVAQANQNGQHLPFINACPWGTAPHTVLRKSLWPASRSCRPFRPVQAARFVLARPASPLYPVRCVVGQSVAKAGHRPGQAHEIVFSAAAARRVMSVLARYGHPLRFCITPVLQSVPQSLRDGSAPGTSRPPHITRLNNKPKW